MAREKPQNSDLLPISRNSKILRFDQKRFPYLTIFYVQYMYHRASLLICINYSMYVCFLFVCFCFFLLINSPWSLIPRLNIIFIGLILPSSLKKFKQLSGFPELHPSVQFLLTCLLAVLGFSKTST